MEPLRSESMANQPPRPPFMEPIGIAVGLDGSLYVSEADAHRIRKISQPAESIVSPLSGEIPFAEENGLGHIFSSAGRHLKTVDLETGRDLYTFDYDADGRVVFVSDRFGNPTAIERDAAGRPFAVVSPDGLRTTLTVNGQNHLTAHPLPGRLRLRLRVHGRGAAHGQDRPGRQPLRALFRCRRPPCVRIRSGAGQLAVCPKR